jgi:RNA polymerase sigma factor (TIGR02999 family)
VLIKTSPGRNRRRVAADWAIWFFLFYPANPVHALFDHFEFWRKFEDPASHALGGTLAYGWGGKRDRGHSAVHNTGELTAAGTDKLYAALYEQLRQEARKQRRRVGGGVDTTALVNESYLKLMRSDLWQSRQHFLRTAAAAMRQVLVDEARARLAEKRGSGDVPMSLDKTGMADIVPGAHDDPNLTLGIDAALNRLAQHSARLARVVECRYFAGYSEQETAEILEVNERTVRRDWTKARAFLFAELEGA